MWNLRFVSSRRLWRIQRTKDMKQFFNPESLETEYSKYIDSLLIQQFSPKGSTLLKSLISRCLIFACFGLSHNLINQPTTSNPVSQGRLCEKCDGKCVICDSYATWRLPKCGLGLEFTQLSGILINPKEFHENDVHLCPPIWEGLRRPEVFSKSRLFVCHGLFQMKRAELQILIGTVPRDSEGTMGWEAMRSTFTLR